MFWMTELKYVSFMYNMVKPETLYPILHFLTLSYPLLIPFQVGNNKQF